MTTILVADRDRAARRLTAAALRLGGYGVEVAFDLDEAGALVRRKRLAAVVCDPSEDQPDSAVRRLRLRTEVPIIVLGTKSGVADGVSVLDAGADDYLVKPFDMEDLLARLRAVLRRVTPPETVKPLATEDFTIDIEERRWIRSDGNEVALTPTEWRLVEALIERDGHLVSHRDLLARVWGLDSRSEKQYLRVYMASLRRKVEPDPHHPRYFMTVTGFGLRFDSHGTPSGQRMPDAVAY